MSIAKDTVPIDNTKLAKEAFEEYSSVTDEISSLYAEMILLKKRLQEIRQDVIPLKSFAHRRWCDYMILKNGKKTKGFKNK